MFAVNSDYGSEHPDTEVTVSKLAVELNVKDYQIVHYLNKDKNIFVSHKTPLNENTIKLVREKFRMSE